MLCPKCKVELVTGMAIEPGSRGVSRSINGYQYVSNAETMEIIEVLKCPKCGYSDDGIN